MKTAPLTQHDTAVHKESNMRAPNPPPSFVVGGYPPDPCTRLLSLRLRDTPDTRRLLEQLKDLPDVLARGGSMTIFIAGEWVGRTEDRGATGSLVDQAEPVTEAASPSPTCRHCGMTLADHEPSRGREHCIIAHTFEPGPTYAEVVAQNMELKQALAPFLDKLPPSDEWLEHLTRAEEAIGPNLEEVSARYVARLRGQEEE